jgi:hypothetical protein
LVALDNSLTVTFAAKSSRDEELAFGIDVEGVDHGAEDMTVVALIVFKGFFGSDLLVVGFMEEMIIQGAPVVETCLHDGSPQVFAGTGDCEFAFLFQSL